MIAARILEVADQIDEDVRRNEYKAMEAAVQTGVARAFGGG